MILLIFQKENFYRVLFIRCLDVWYYTVGNVHVWRRTVGWFKRTRDTQQSNSKLDRCNFIYSANQ